MSLITLETPVTAIDSVSKVIAARLRRLDITTTGELLFYFPARYENYGQPVAIKDLEPGMMATVSGAITLVANRRSPRQRKLLTEALLTDATGSIQLIWFNQPWIGKQLKIGQQLFVSGKVQGDMFATQFVSPTYELAKHGAPRALVPIYSLTEGLTNKRLQELILAVLDEVKAIPDFLPPYMCEQAGLLSLDEAVRTIHDPSDDKVLAAARFRLSFQELL
nr:hypothetical protein [Candidatus Buchananbacteria bacterium]